VSDSREGAPPRLSVGIPAYNQCEFIGETLESLLQQTQAPAEIVVSENHSEDDTPRVLERFAGHIRVVRPAQHLSMTENWDFTLTQLRESWFSLLSSDDIALPRFVEDLTELAASVDDAVLVRGGYQVIDAIGEPTKKKFFGEERTVLRYPENLVEQLRAPRTSFTAFAAHTETCRRVGGFLRDDGFAGDWSMWIRLSPFGAFVYEPRIFSQYRGDYRSPEGERARFLNFLKTQQRVYDVIMSDVVRAHGRLSQDQVRAASVRRCHAFLASASRLFGASERARVTALAESWARSCGLEAELAALANGEVIERTPRSSPVRLLRRIGRRVRSLARLRRRDYLRPDL